MSSNIGTVSDIIIVNFHGKPYFDRKIITMQKLLPVLLLVLTVASCGIISKSSKIEFQDGFYSQKTGDKKQLVYVNIEDEMLNVYPAKGQEDLKLVDSAISQFYPEKIKDTQQSISFNKRSFDIDFLTLPIKYRPAQSGLPSQLNSNLNGAAYFGYRTDKYNVRYKADPFGDSERKINHFGFSMGVFTGIGNTVINPTTTNDNISIDYDGVIWPKGVAGIVGFNNFTIGLSVGFDNLLDKNKKFWIYETRPWLGLVFGLNLN